MHPLRGVPTFMGVAVAMLFSIVLWGLRRGRGPQTGVVAAGDDWTGRMLVWLLVLAAFVAGAFISFVLIRP